jgi:raffinose/stachyose/melibiose transport system substrate-binding protein
MFRANPKGNRTQRQVVPRPGILVLSLTLLALVVGACAPGSSVAPSTSTAASTPAATSGASQPAGPSGSATAAGPTCGTSPVVLNAYFETGFDLPFKLSAEFTKQFPNVTWNISQDQFSNLMTSTPRLLAGDNPPDLIRLPTMVSLVKDKLLKNLDDYVTAFGWDKWPAAQLAQNRVGSDGTRGSGSLYAAGLNYSLTGVFYNKKLATQIGMTQPPATVAAFEDLLAKAKAANLQPIMAWNASASGGGLASPSNSSWQPMVRRSRSTTGSSRSRGRRSTHRPT